MTSDESRLRLVDYLSHMLEAVRLAREYVAGASKDDSSKTGVLNRQLFSI